MFWNLEESTLNGGVFFFDVKNVEAGEGEDKRGVN